VIQKHKHLIKLTIYLSEVAFMINCKVSLKRIPRVWNYY